MNEISPTYALDIAEQMSLVGVFLGAISVTILMSLVIFSSPGKLVNWIIGISAFASCCLLISVVASLRVIIAVHPEFPSPETTSPSEISLLWKLMVAGYAIGVLNLIVSIGLSGWLRTRKTGMVTMTFSIAAILLFIYTSVYN